MVNVTVTVPEDFKEKMSEHQEINWSEVAREAFEQKIVDLETIERLKDFEVMDEIAEGSDLTEEDAAKIAEKIDQDMRKDFLGDEQEWNRSYHYLHTWTKRFEPGLNFERLTAVHGFLQRKEESETGESVF